MKFLVLLGAAFLVSCSAKDLFERQLDALLDDADAKFSCKGKNNGDYAYPNDCHKFYKCAHGDAYPFDCPPGLVFNAEKDMCDYDINVPGCHSGGGDAFSCVGKKDGDYANPDDCHSFYTCSNERASPATKCPAGLGFDAEHDKCEYVQKVPACNKGARDEDYFTDNDVSNFCKYRENGNYQDPENCAGYIGCSGHLTYRLPCPKGLRYNTPTKKCDYPKNVECWPRPTNVPVTTTRPNADTCADTSDGDYPDPKNCNGFISCSNHIAHHMPCPGNLRYDTKKKRCEWPGDVNCGDRPTTKPLPPPTPTPSTGECAKRRNGNYPDPHNCNGFITCANHITYRMDCPSNLRYSTETKRCEHPQDVNCGFRPPHHPNPPFPNPGYSAVCKRLQSRVVRIRDAHNCLGYIWCIYGYAYRKNCPTGLRYNWQKGRCDLPRNVKCRNAGGPWGGTFCRGRKNGDYTDVVNCNGFIKCSNQYTYYFDCPSNLWFNWEKDQCDWQRNVKCPYM